MIDRVVTQTMTCDWPQCRVSLTLTVDNQSRLVARAASDGWLRTGKRDWCPGEHATKAQRPAPTGTRRSRRFDPDLPDRVDPS